MRKFFVILLMAVFLTFVSFGSSGHEVEAAKKPKRGYVAATTTYQAGGHKSTSRGIDMFMTKGDANAYAAKLNTSYKSTIAWAGASFIPKIGPYISVAGVATTLESQKRAKQILKLTKRGKKVHVSVKNGMISVKEWNGKASSIKTSMPKSSTKKRGGITTKITTKINKKQVKY